MKHGKKPTVEQRKILERNGLLWSEWLIVKDLPLYMEIVHRVTREKRGILK